MKSNTSITILFILLALAVLQGCQDDDNDTPGNEFDRKAMLQHYADNLIKPAYQDLQVKVQALKETAGNFIQSPGAPTLLAAQMAWEQAYESWMYANAYNFGPAGEEGIRKTLVEEIGIFPVDLAAIEDNIAAGNSSLNDFNRDNRGLLAVDYLLFDLGSNPDNIIQAFQSNPMRGTYLQAVVDKIKDQVDEVVTEWNGSYATTFVNNAGTDAGSSASLLFNEFAKSYESIKNFKVGIPLGKRAGQTAAEPEKVEARYSRLSLRYLKAHLNAIDDIWQGRSRAGADGTGWKEYLLAVTGGPDLVAATETQMANIRAVLDAIPENPSFEQLIQENNPLLAELHTELQIHTRNYKSDMSSLLGISITFVSGDGD